jgi:hypothetical protein
MTKPADSDNIIIIIEKLLRDECLFEALYLAPVNLTELPASFAPARPGVMPLIVDHAMASDQKLSGTVRQFERLITHHQLIAARIMEPSETALDVPAQPLLNIAFRLRPRSKSSKLLRGTIQAGFAGTPGGMLFA